MILLKEIALTDPNIRRQQTPVDFLDDPVEGKRKIFDTFRNMMNCAAGTVKFLLVKDRRNAYGWYELLHRATDLNTNLLTDWGRMKIKENPNRMQEVVKLYDEAVDHLQQIVSQINSIKNDAELGNIINVYNKMKHLKEIFDRAIDASNKLLDFK